MEETTLLYHCRALCMDEADTLLDNAFVVVQGTTIRSVGTERPAGPFAREIDCRGNVLMPGLVNAHTHIPMTLLRGYGGELHLFKHVGVVDGGDAVGPQGDVHPGLFHGGDPGNAGAEL